MENINIVEILRNCPKGMELDCTIWDNVVFDHIDMKSNYPIYIKKMGGEKEYLTEDGCFNFDLGAKCVIFPKGKTTWEGFQRPFKDGDIVAIDSTNGCSQVFIFKEYVREKSDYAYCYMFLDDDGTVDFECGNYYVERFATEEEKQKLFQAIKDNGYRWNPETKTLEKLIEPKFKVGDRIRHKVTNKDDVYEISKVYDDSYGLVGFTWMFYMKYQDQYELVPNKFDITTLVPFESKVLVRDYEHVLWQPSWWGIYEKEHMFPYITLGGRYKQCIPYKGNEHLLGTANDCDEHFKTWK